MGKTLDDILNEFRDAKRSMRDMGDKFEKLMRSALLQDYGIAGEFSDVWLWSQFPYRKNLPDTGIDLIAKESLTGDFIAIQCKFFDPEHRLMKDDIDSFFTASGKKFETEDGKRSFSKRIVISTTDDWSIHAEEALVDQSIPTNRIRIEDLRNSIIDWSQYSLERPEEIKRKPKKTIRPHQEEAIVSVQNGFKSADRGKLIMACGTGKTYTSLKIVERIVPSGGTVLFLVPSIALLSQTLREWTAEAEAKIHCLAVCSDSKAGTVEEDIHVHDLSYPATTDLEKLKEQIEKIQSSTKILKKSEKFYNIIFSTYQSIDVVSKAQKKVLPEFDLIICDEAHRTTGATEAGTEDSAFVKVHDQKNIKAKKRLYMTATPRIYSEDSKQKASQKNIDYWSMDDEETYGKEFHNLSFSKAISNDLLSDYKVMVLAVNEKYINKVFQMGLASEDNELKLDDIVKIVGCWNGLMKKTIHDENDESEEIDPNPMKRAVAFNRSIKDSEAIKKLFSRIIEKYVEDHKEEDALICDVDHVDGGMNTLLRNKKVDWLKAETPANQCRILSNARCLSEGVDVPALDGVIFLNPRNSVVDVVQSVGRVMRKAEGKKYGYIILPIGIPDGVTPEEALADNKKYKVVWQVLQALRAHDDRFNADINKIELNKNKPKKIRVIGVGGEKSDGGGEAQDFFGLANLDTWKDAIYAKIVQKCGDRKYWENWAKDVAEISKKHCEKIKELIHSKDKKHKKEFDIFLDGLKKNINPSVNEDEAIEMLSQHLITRPVFEALFDNGDFAKNNPISQALEGIVSSLDVESFKNETDTLKRFYQSVQERAVGIDNSEGKQKIIIELYDKFFQYAFPKLQKRLGIVYTPIEVVDFIIQSANDVMVSEFGKSLSDEGVNVIDPFTGTGTFIVRLLQSGLIKKDDLIRKYNNEIFANEIVLLAYYIATVNIEARYTERTGQYKSFAGAVLTDTFQIDEYKGTLLENVFTENHARLNKMKNSKFSVIIGNPPYSAKQEESNDNNQNQDYPALDKSIRETYAEKSTATNKNNLYDSYIRAIRWASNRIEGNGLVAFVTNGSFIEGNAADGIRKCLGEEFSSIYCFNLRGDARTSGEKRKLEAGNVFDSGTRTPVAITIFVKNKNKKSGCDIFYHDIGDSLDRKEKLKIISDFGTIANIRWNKITPNAEGDWINHRSNVFSDFLPVYDEEDATSIFKYKSRGLETSRDPWMYNFSNSDLQSNVKKMIEIYNSETEKFKENCLGKQRKDWAEVKDVVTDDSRLISWSSSLYQKAGQFKLTSFSKSKLRNVSYRPYCKTNVYFDNFMNHRIGSMLEFFPKNDSSNFIITASGVGTKKDFSAIMTSSIPDIHLSPNGQCFPLYFYDKDVKVDSISESSLTVFKSHYGEKVKKEDIFYYVYGIFHSKEYTARFTSDLKKMLPRIPFAQDFWSFSKAGRLLAELHLNYETVSCFKVIEICDKKINPKADLRVSKMTFGKTGKEVDKSIIIYNENVRLEGIPLVAYEYIVNGQSALEWIMERYQVTIDKASGIENDPNDWSGDPRYILDLVKRIVTVSVETMKIVKALPPLNEIP